MVGRAIRRYIWLSKGRPSRWLAIIAVADLAVILLFSLDRQLPRRAPAVLLGPMLAATLWRWYSASFRVMEYCSRSAPRFRRSDPVPANDLQSADQCGGSHGIGCRSAARTGDSVRSARCRQIQ